MLFTLPKQRKVRSTPRISANELAEYLRAGAVKRRSIIRGQKYPADYVVARYADASKAIIDYLCGNAGAVDHQLGRLHSRILGGSGNTFSGDCIEALESFRVRFDGLGLDGNEIAITRAPIDAPKLDVSGVQISVRPEMYLEATDKNGGKRFGMLKLHFSKPAPIDEKAGADVATVMKMWAVENMDGKPPHDKLIIVLDVFTAGIYTAPKSYINRVKNIKAACEEIAAIWPTL